jgi:hypothetical protein
MNVREIRLVVEEIARVALEREDISRYIGKELDLSDEVLNEVYAELEKKLNEVEFEKEIKLYDEEGNYMGMMGGHEVRK